MKPHFTLLLLSLLLFACTSQEVEKTSQETPKEDIHAKIKKDLEDGISHPQTIEVDESDLPKIKRVAERAHSSISFRTKHFEVVDLIGWFADFEVVMYYETDDFSDAVIFARANPASFVMPNFQMAGSLKNPEYLDAEQFPQIMFSSTKLELLGDGKYKLFGMMDMKGIKKEMEIDVTFNGYAYPDEKRLAGFNIAGAFSRHDFNIAPNDMLHSGNPIHGDSIWFEGSFRMERIQE